jgi:RHS repeat-associated protein
MPSVSFDFSLGYSAMLPDHSMPQSDPKIPSFLDFEVKNDIQAVHVAPSSKKEYFRPKSMAVNELKPCHTPKKTGGVTVYGYRHYTPKTGQFLGRDPIGENGGMNLYGFVGNDGVDSIDSYGLSSSCSSDTVGFRVKDLNFEAPGGGALGLEGRISLGFRGSRRKCCSICSDGSIKSVYTFSGTFSYDSLVELRLGPQINATLFGGKYGIKGHIGIQASQEGRFEFAGGWKWDACNNTLDFSAGGNIFLEGKIGAGFKGGLYFGNGKSIKASGFYGGYAIFRLGVHLTCNAKSCSTLVRRGAFDVGLTGQIGGDLFGKSVSFRHNYSFLENVSGEAKILDMQFPTPNSLKQQ